MRRFTVVRAPHPDLCAIAAPGHSADRVAEHWPAPAELPGIATPWPKSPLDSPTPAHSPERPAQLAESAPRPRRNHLRATPDIPTDFAPEQIQDSPAQLFPI